MEFIEALGWFGSVMMGSFELQFPCGHILHCWPVKLCFSFYRWFA